MKKNLIILAGPTAVGKSQTAIELAKRINGSIVSADSMQVYKGMDIGSAKMRRDEMQGIDHYLIDCLDPKDDFHVVAFKQMANDAMNKIWAKGRIPILTGGTGFYIQAVLYDIDFGETTKDVKKRADYQEYASKYGAESLHELLKAVDPEAAGQIHPNNVKRVIRALEFHDETGRQISGHNEEQHAKESPYRFAYYVLTDDRARLYKRIDERVDQMMKDGLEEEVRSLYESGMQEDDISMKGIGYREFFPYFRGEKTLPETVASIKTDTRHFAKRQITWFKRERDARWIDIADFKRDPAKIAEYITKNLAKDGML